YQALINAGITMDESGQIHIPPEARELAKRALEESYGNLSQIQANDVVANLDLTMTVRSINALGDAATEAASEMSGFILAMNDVKDKLKDWEISSGISALGLPIDDVSLIGGWLGLKGLEEIFRRLR